MYSESLGWALGIAGSNGKNEAGGAKHACACVCVCVYVCPILGILKEDTEFSSVFSLFLYSILVISETCILW